MRRSAWIVGMVLLALWGVCLGRAVAQHRDVVEVFEITGSLNAWNDVVHQRTNLAGQVLMAGIGLGAVARLLRRRASGRACLPAAASLIAAVRLTAFPPEHLVVLIPDPSVLRWTALVLASACLAPLLPRFGAVAAPAGAMSGSPPPPLPPGEWMTGKSVPFTPPEGVK